ncbi:MULTISPECIES: zinc-ribbon and DUF3426 domain-containing protein [Methylotenera]|uniref:zinc-ribbon and DUF3426 domain-containing protein n=1 Tax=Methylotenera TaxID=359407 RepID=UPI00036FE0E1|nr:MULTISPECIES: zinc-ribbon and DUF3426 domain-containing protein [Methylotenera]
MNYITACPACETQFLITKEHLKAYRGKVQCGNCNHVFNAKNRLTEVSDDIQSVEEYSVAEDGATENIVAESDSTEHDSDLYTPAEYANTELAADSKIEPNPTLTNDIEIEASAVESTASEPIKSLPISNTDEKPISQKLNVVLEGVPDLSDLTSSELAQANLGSIDTTRNPYISNLTPIIISEDDVDIESIRAPILIEDLTADPKFQLTKPKRNFWLIAINCLLLLAAILQSAYFLRSKIAADYPQFKPYLVQACEHLRCKIHLPQQLDLLSIDDSDMQESQIHQDVVDFSSLIINNSNHVQAYPNIELTLTDAEDKPVLRKLVKPQEYLQPTTDPAKGIGAHDEERIKLAINVHALSVAGYRVLLTY